MTIYDPAPHRSFWTPPRRLCALLVAIALGLALLPPRAAQPLKSALGTLLRPGLVVTYAVGQRCEALIVRLRGILASSEDWMRLERELAAVRTRNQALQAAVIVVNATSTAPSQRDAAAMTHGPLVALRSIEARVLGRQAQAFLGRDELLDVGISAGVAVDNLVVDAPALVDRGAAAGVEAESLVLAGRRVWGKVHRAGQRISHIRRATEAGYRDLVQLGHRPGDRQTPGPRGVLEGTGEPLCRIRLVPVTESVSIGDPVFTDGGQGLLPRPLLYGEIVRLERTSGGTHWEIWMRPALEGYPERVAVLAAKGEGERERGGEGE